VGGRSGRELSVVTCHLSLLVIGHLPFLICHLSTLFSSTAFDFLLSTSFSVLTSLLRRVDAAPDSYFEIAPHTVHPDRMKL
jgi:hypothetical protein